MFSMKQKIKTAVKRIIKKAYRILPLPEEYKIKLKNRIYILSSPIIKNTFSYKVWKSQYEMTKSECPLETTANQNILEKYVNQILSIPYQGQKEPEYEPKSLEPVELTEEDIKYIAFYLPQFHPFKENDEWWGKGFTEWTNTTKAIPQFCGHYQPRLAGELGYYDLRSSEAIKEQMDLAKHYGISGFCIYYYWFDGQRLLDKPLEIILNNKELDLPFCLCWANENWTRRWDGQNHDILMAQNYDNGFALKFIKDIIVYFKDDRYLKINGKPVFVVYNANAIPELDRVIDVWRTYCREQGIGEIHLLAVDYILENSVLHADFDGFVEFPPHATKDYDLHLINDKELIVNPNFTGRIFDYEQIVREKKYLRKTQKKFYKGIMLAWDNTPRNKFSPAVYHNFSFGLFKEWLTDISIFTKKHLPSEEQMVFINAWNEWAEGTYLEPDRKYGYAALNTLKDVIFDLRSQEYLNETPMHNKEIYSMRWKYIQEKLLLEIDEIKYKFIQDYIAAIKYFNKIAGKNILLSEKGSLYWTTKENLPKKINKREDLSEIYYEYCNKKNEEMIFAFIILQYNNEKFTIKCIESLRKLNGSNINFVIVDNGSKKESLDIIQKLYSDDSNINILVNSENQGFARGNNLGYTFARETLKADFISIINNDVTIDDTDFIEKVYELFDKWTFSVLGPSIIVQGAREENPINHYIYNNNELEKLLALYENERYQYLKDGIACFNKMNPVDRSRNVILNPILQGAAFVFSPIFIESNEIAFDESTFIYGEEILLSVRCLLDGQLALYTNEISVNHHEAATTDTIGNDKKIMMGYDNAILAIKKAIDLYENETHNYASRDLKTIKPDEISYWIDKKKNNILFDLFFCQPGFHGGGEYGKTIFKYLAERISKTDGTQLWAAANVNVFMEEWIWDICKKYRVTVVNVEGYEGIAECVNRGVFDAFFAPAIVVYSKGYEYMKRAGKELLFTSTKTKIIGTLHDIRDYELTKQTDSIYDHLNKYSSKKQICKINSFIDNPQLYAKQLNEMYNAIISSNEIDIIITVSEYSKQSMIRNICKEAERIIVLYPPRKNSLTPREFAVNGIDFTKDNYALLIHADRTEKNAISAIVAMNELIEENIKQNKKTDLKMVITGINDLSEIGIENVHPDSFICTGYLKSEHLEFLYENAKFLVYPSFNEGFGSPPIEAMSHNVPSVVTNVSSVPEICNDAVIYCDPYNITSIKDAIIQISEGKIDESKIRKRYEYITHKQNEDLQKLGDLITGIERDSND